MYNEATSGEFNIKFNGCTFNTSNTSKNKPAIAVNSLGAQFNIIITNCTANEFANGTSIEDDAMTDWHTNHMKDASEADRKLVGCEEQLDKIGVKIHGKEYQ